MLRVSMIIGFLGIAFIAQVAAHGHLSVPISRDSVFTTDVQDAPVAFPLASDFVCRNHAALAASEWPTLTAGSNNDITWQFEAPHPGDCFAYISYDVALPDTQKNWFKVAEWNECENVNGITQTFTLPSYLPPCDHCVLRWEWYALHLQSVGTIEFYAQCSDVTIVGGSATGTLPTPQVTIPGHLPMDAQFYRNEYDDPDLIQFTGPPIATQGGAAWSCTNTYGASCTTPPVTNNPCAVSQERCVTASTFQSCEIGVGTTLWGPSQSCQTGLVCEPNSDATRIYCVDPSTVTTPPPSSTSTTGQSSTSTTGKSSTSTTGKSSTSTTGKPSTSTTGKPSTSTTTTTTGKSSTSTTGKPSTTTTTGKSSTSTTGKSSSTSTSGKASTSTSTTGKAASTPSTTGSTAPPSPATSCTLGDQRCATSSTYQTCSLLNRNGDTYWASAQTCNTGLSCQASATGTNIYCV